jgi:hypothetical protein
MARWTKRNISITVLHPGTSADLLTVSGVGDLTVTGIGPDNEESVPVYERDEYVGLVRGQESEQELAWSINLPKTAATDPVAYLMLDWLRNAGAFAALDTADPGGEVMTYKVRVLVDDGTTDWGWVFNSLECRGDIAEGDVLKLNVKATNRGGYTLT